MDCGDQWICTQLKKKYERQLETKGDQGDCEDQWTSKGRRENNKGLTETMETGETMETNGDVHQCRKRQLETNRD